MAHPPLHPAHASTCPTRGNCINILSTASVAAALAPISVSALLKRCADVGLPCRANATKLHIAGQLVSRAEEALTSITSDTCAKARDAFASRFGWFTRVLLQSDSVPNDELSVPWHANRVRASNLLATLDQLTCTELREVLLAQDIKCPRNTRKGGLTFLFMERFEATLDTYYALTDGELRDWIVTYYAHSAPPDFTRSDLLLSVLDYLVPEQALVILMTCPYPSPNPTARTLRLYRETRLGLLASLRRRLRHAAIQDYWPQHVSQYLKLTRMSEYHTASQFRAAKPCACCARSRVDFPVNPFLFVNGVNAEGVCLDVLECQDLWLLHHPTRPFNFLDSTMCGHVLDPVGLLQHSRNHTTVLLCSECESPLRKRRIPKLSLRNALFRGSLPPELQDITWIEERVCALYRITSNISRLFGSTNPELPFVLYGNTCAHPQNVVDTAKVLPRTAGDVANHIGVMFVGPGKYKAKGLSTFRVRKAKLIAFMLWLIRHNYLYRDIPFDMSRFDEYPEDGPLPGIEARLVHDESDDAAEQFERETAGLDPHPAVTGKRLSPDDEFVFMDALGITDSSADSIGARTFEAAALNNLLPSTMRTPDMTLHRGSSAVPEYGNSKLFLGLYPKLFPFGIGGLEDFESQGDKNRVGFRVHANYLIDLHDRQFSSHPEFMFVVVNILQRRAVHLETRFRLRTSRMEALAPELLALTPEQIQRVATQLAESRSYASIAAEDKPVLELLRVVETVGAKVPGSHASKQALRRKIFAMCRHFGVPQVYLTLNPNPIHSPLFHLMAGDVSIDLSKRYPRVAKSIERSLRVASDPAMASYFFELSIRMVFEHLFGWDFQNGCSKPEGGILGHLEAFAMSDELTNRGVLHGHAVLWLRGGLNPSDARARLAADSDFQDRFFKFWEEAIRHHLPDVDFVQDVEVNPRQERPLQPPTFASELMHSNADPTEDQSRELKDWADEFTFEVKRMGEETQRHTHKDVCRAYGFQGVCRFQFPHEVIPDSYFDTKTNSIYLRCLDGTVNYFNPELLVMCRHNHDIKCILSGRAAKAAVYYITNYITKLDINAHNVLSMVAQASHALSQRPLPAGQTVELRTLLHKCLARITREQQLHAQKAARYIRGLDDSLVSHTTVPMMTGLLWQYVQKTYMPDEPVDEEPPDDDDGLELDVSPDDSAPMDFAPGQSGPENLDPSQDIRINVEGHLEIHSQLEDYLYRGLLLADLNYYDFVKLLRLVPLKGSASPRRFDLDPRHSRSATHRLEYRSSDGVGMTALEFVPMSLGPGIPRKSTANYYRLFCLAHFKPFSADVPLIPSGGTISSCYLNYQFDGNATRRMENWEALHECEDERDAERLKQQARKVTDRALPFGLLGVDEAGYTLDPDMIPETETQRGTYKTWATLLEAGWFARREDDAVRVSPRIVDDNIVPTVMKKLTKSWRAAVKCQEQTKPAEAAADEARTTSNALSEPPDTLPRTEGLTACETPTLTVELAEQFAEKRQLNTAQRRAFSITIRCCGQPATALSESLRVEHHPQPTLTQPHPSP